MTVVIDDIEIGEFSIESKWNGMIRLVNDSGDKIIAIDDRSNNMGFLNIFSTTNTPEEIIDQLTLVIMSSSLIGHFAEKKEAVKNE